jgi:hypothetical protein
LLGASLNHSGADLPLFDSFLLYSSYSDQNTVRLENFTQHSTAPLILKKRLLPRLFEVMDSKKENLIEFESYFCTLSLLRRSNLDELSKCRHHIPLIMSCDGGDSSLIHLIWNQ